MTSPLTFFAVPERKAVVSPADGSSRTIVMSFKSPALDKYHEYRFQVTVTARHAPQAGWNGQRNRSRWFLGGAGRFMKSSRAVFVGACAAFIANIAIGQTAEVVEPSGTATGHHSTEP